MVEFCIGLSDISFRETQIKGKGGRVNQIAGHTSARYAEGQLILWSPPGECNHLISDTEL